MAKKEIAPPEITFPIGKEWVLDAEIRDGFAAIIAIAEQRILRLTGSVSGLRDFLLEGLAALDTRAGHTEECDHQSEIPTELSEPPSSTETHSD